jgi:transposase
VAAAYQLTQEFARMIRELEGEKLNEWLEEARCCEIPGIKRFAKGLEKDLSAVVAGLMESWSNGPVEGFVLTS